MNKSFFQNGKADPADAIPEEAEAKPLEEKPQEIQTQHAPIREGQPTGKQTFMASEEEDARTKKRLLPSLDQIQDPSELIEVFISSRNIATTTRYVKGKARKFIEGKLMGTRKVLDAEGNPVLDKDGKAQEQFFSEEFEVECDRIIYLPFYVAHHFKAYIS